MSKQNEPLKSDPQEGIRSAPVNIETERVFNQDYLEEPDASAFIDNPMAALMQPLIQYFEAIKPPMAFITPPKTEHKVRIFYFDPERTIKAEVAAEIEALLNDGYCCHIPTVVGDYVIMDFSRRKETKEDGE